MLVFIHGYKRKRAGYSKLPVFGIHLLDENFDQYFNAGVPNADNPSYQFDQSARRNGLRKINLVGGHRHDFLSCKPGRGDKSGFIHQRHGRAAKQGVIMIRRVREHRLENSCLGFIYFFFHPQYYNTATNFFLLGTVYKEKYKFRTTNNFYTG